MADFESPPIESSPDAVSGHICRIASAAPRVPAGILFPLKAQHRVVGEAYRERPPSQPWFDLLLKPLHSCAATSNIFIRYPNGQDKACSQRWVSAAGKYQSSMCPFDLGKSEGMLSVSKVESSARSKVSGVPKYQSSICPPDLGRPEAAQDRLLSRWSERMPLVSKSPWSDFFEDSGWAKYHSSICPPDLGNSEPR